MTTKYEIQPIAWVVKPKGASLFANGVTTIKRDDEGAGQFIVVSQCDDDSKSGEVRFDAGEWPSIKQAIETAINEILADELHEFKDPTPEPEPEPTGAELVGKECWFSDDGVVWENFGILGNSHARTCNGFGERGYTWGLQGKWWKYAKLYRVGVKP